MAGAEKVVLLACGSFNPPTYMHLRMFEIARDQLGNAGVRVVGGVVSPTHDGYGKKDLVSAQHRCAMLRLALRSSNWIKMSDWETRQEGWTRTRLVLEHHQRELTAAACGQSAELPNWLPDDVLNVNTDQLDNAMSNGDTDNYNNNMGQRLGSDRGGVIAGQVRVKLLCGADLLESFAKPGLWREDDMEAIAGRHGMVVISRAGGNPERFIEDSDTLYRHRRNITLLTNWVSNEVSSTALRRLLRRGESVKYLTDDGVAQYARAHLLYNTEDTPTSEHIL